MSQENVEIVRSALAALDRRDVEAYLELASPEIELITPASPLEGPTTGHDGIRRFFSELETYAKTSAFQVEEIRAVDSQVLAFFTLTALGRLAAQGCCQRALTIFHPSRVRTRCRYST